MKAQILVLAALISLGNSVHAAPEAAVGQSTLKLEPVAAVSSVREARQELVVVEKEIATLDKQIIDAKSKAFSARAAARNTPAAANFEALATAYEMDRAKLVAKKSDLQTVLTTSQE